jgi:hypothetical protein
MYEEIVDEVLTTTYASFSPAGFRPTAFVRGSRRYLVRRVNSSWRDRSLTPPRHGFSVTTDTGEIFQLTYTDGEPFWRLESILNE